MISKDMTIAEVVQKFPQTIPVFQQFGLGCIGCSIANMETVEQGSTMHGLDTDALIEALNDAVSSNGEAAS